MGYEESDMLDTSTEFETGGEKANVIIPPSADQ